jgi:sarcosine oxidase subunit beta
VTGIELDGREIRAVETTAGRIETGTAVCCAGVWSPEIGRMVGVELPVEPVFREVGFTGPHEVLPEHPPLTVDFSTGLYFHREGPGLLFGMADPDQKPGFDEPAPPGWLEKVVAVAERRLPQLLEMGIAGGWRGYYDVSPDHNAIVGESAGVSRFLYATGFSGHGFLQAPAVGELVRDLYLGREPFVDIAPLSANRFDRGAERPEKNII